MSSSTLPQDSNLAFGFGPQSVGGEFFPPELTVGGDLLLPEGPVPTVDLAASGCLPEVSELLPPEDITDSGGSPSVAAASHLPTGEGRQAATLKPALQFWLDGDVLLCRCPDCSAPMTVRIWCAMAECWRCGTCIELTEEQERDVARALDRLRKAAPHPTKPPIPAPVQRAALGAPPVPAERFRGAAPPPAPPTSPAPPPLLRAIPRVLAPPIAAPPLGRRSPRVPQAVIPSASRWLDDLFKGIPAWLISMLVHLIGITLLALLTTDSREETEPFITITTVNRSDRKVEGEEAKVELSPEAQFDLPLPNKADLNDPKKREALVKANQDAKELRLDEAQPAPLPDLQVVRQKLGSKNDSSANFLARDPRLRVEVVNAEGGTTLTEAAVARGLRWLSQHQNEDGSWSLSGFRKSGGCNCGGDGVFRQPSPGTALALLPFLGAGQTHQVGRYQHHVSRGLRWLIENQQSNGDLRAGSHDNSGMYTQGQATIVLCEAFAMTGDETLRSPAQKAVDFIVKAQYHDGGWRYTPGPPQQAGDTSVVGWQLMAMQSARSANLTVPDETLARAGQFLDSVQHQNGARYGYIARQHFTPTMTAEALLCRMYLGWTRQDAGLLQGARWLVDEHLPNEREPNIYYWYYGSQAMHHLGGPEWEQWNLRMRDLLVNSQEKAGHVAGSWTPRGVHSSEGGRIYMSSLAICTLEVYYRHLPLFKQLELAR